MKKIFLFVLIVCMCVVLGACTATDPNNLFGTISEDISSEEISYYTGAYQYGNMQNSSAHRFMLLDNEVVFGHCRYTHDGYLVCTRLFSYDLITGEVHSFCKDATCTHENCASSPIITQIEVYNGKLYGTNHEWQILEATETGADVIVSSKVEELFHHGDKLYAKTVDSSLVVFEEGKKDPRMVVEEYTGCDAVIFDNYLYAEWSFRDFVRIDLSANEPKEEVIVENCYGITDGNHIYYIDRKTHQLFRCDLDGKNIQLLVDHPVYDLSFNFDDEYFYYRLYTDMQETGHPDSRDIYRFPKEDPTKIEKIATLPHSVRMLYTVPGTGKLFVSTFYEPGDEEVTYYVMGTDGSNPTKLEIPEY